MAPSITSFFILTSYYLAYSVLAQDLPIQSHTYNFNRTVGGGYCNRYGGCVCGTGKLQSYVHCESIVDIVYDFQSSSVTMECFSKTPNDAFRYLSGLEMNPKNVNGIHMIVNGCPPPTHNYSSLFHPIGLEEEKSQLQPFSIQGLRLTCGLSQDFSIERHHFAGFESLKVLDIDCKSLTTFPERLIDGVSKDLIQFSLCDSSVETLPHNLLSKFTRLERLSLGSNKLRRIPIGFFSGTGNLELLSLEHNGIYDVHDDVFVATTKIKELKLNDNHLSKLPKSICTLDELTNLTVANNYLTDIEPNCFHGFRSLVRLDLSRNYLKMVDSRILSGLEKLEYFDVSSNRMEGTQIFTLYSEGLSGDVLSEVNNHSASFLPENLFSGNVFLQEVYIQNINLASLPENIFFNNLNLIKANVSSNRLMELPPKLLEKNVKLQSLDLSNNILISLSEGFVKNLSELKFLDLSKNKIKSLGETFFLGSHKLQDVELNNNLIDYLPYEIFFPFNESLNLEILNLAGNLLTELPNLNIPTIVNVNLAGNRLVNISELNFMHLEKLKYLNLSGNLLKAIDFKIQNIGSFKSVQLQEGQVHASMTSKLEILDLSKNDIPLVTGIAYRHRKDFISVIILYSLKLLDLSNNKLNLKESSWEIDNIKKTWGYVSPLFGLGSLEVLLLPHNEIEIIPMDWRHSLPNLQHLDLSHNRIMYLWHQDFLFSNGILPKDLHSSGYPEEIYIKRSENGTYYQFSDLHRLTVDLRHNQIKGVELPTRLMVDVQQGCEVHQEFSHATLLLGDNPFVCSCQAIQFLRYAMMESRPMSESERTLGNRLVLPAKIDINNLTCWEPVAIRSLNVSEPETWVHHFLPALVFCETR